MSKENKFSGMRVFKISPGDLLLIDPTAYVNLCLLYPHDARTIDEIPALTLPQGHALALSERRDIFLITKSPPSVKHFNKKTLVWVEALSE